jgi:NAD(P)-dependent dehydrogenase (short-subunit alcohol dehydrogenase family)
MSSPVVMLTGALTGIGRSAAIAFAEAKHRVVVSGRRPDAGEQMVGELRALGADCIFVQADVSREAEVSHLVEATIDRFGRLDIAVNCAGTEGKPAAVSEQTVDSYAAMFDTNVLGTLLSMKYELRVMQRQGSGCIVNVSSTMGERGAANMSLYVASKHAVEGLTKSAALEAAGFGVRVNAVAPGPTDTAMLERLTGGGERKTAYYAAVPMKRGATPGEIADAIVFLGSAKASYITGQILRVNGGKTAA